MGLEVVRMGLWKGVGIGVRVEVGVGVQHRSLGDDSSTLRIRGESYHDASSVSIPVPCPIPRHWDGPKRPAGMPSTPKA